MTTIPPIIQEKVVEIFNRDHLPHYSSTLKDLPIKESLLSWIEHSFRNTMVGIAKTLNFEFKDVFYDWQISSFSVIITVVANIGSMKLRLSLRPPT
jgi:hypothetical protein